MKIKVGLPKALLYYYDHDLWKYFFKYLNIEIVESINTNKEILKNGELLAPDEACLALKIFLGHVDYLKNKCDYILIPRLFSIAKNEGVCTNFSCLFDLVNNVVENTNILNYNVDLTTNDSELLGFLKIGKELGISYINTYKAYKAAKEKTLEKRIREEKEQEEKLHENNIKILLAGHPYNLYDEMIGKRVTEYLTNNNITVLYSNKINHKIINTESDKLSTDLYWTHSKEVMASMEYYKDKVDGIIILSSFPCGPDSLANDLVVRKIKNIPILTLIFEDLNSDVGLLTRLESFFDILKQKEEKNETSN